MPVQYKLHYFNARARGELIRMIFATAGIDFEDHKFSFEEWPKIKPTIPTGQVPMLEIDGKKVSQSLAIARYLAREHGLAGNSNMEQLLVDQVIDTTSDMMMEFYKAKFEPEEKKKDEMWKKLFAETVPKFLGLLDKFLGDSYFVGKSMTIADMCVYDNLLTLSKADKDVLTKFPKLKALQELVKCQKGLAEYLKKRPDTDL